MPALELVRQARQVGIVWPGFEQEHAPTGIFGQSSGDNRAGRSSADDDHIEFIGLGHDTSVEARRLQEQTFAGTRRKYELGTATILDIVIGQRDTTTRELVEVDARNQYIRARNNLENILGNILQDYDVSIEEATKGVVSRQPDAVPVLQ